MAEPALRGTSFPEIGLPGFGRGTPLPLPRRVLLVSGDPKSVAALVDDLGASSLEVASVRTGEAAAALVETAKPDIILLDLKSFPNRATAASALETIKATVQSMCPILLLGDGDMLQSWDMLLAADDFILVPVSVEEVVARAVLLSMRMEPRTPEGAIVAGRVVLDLIGHNVLIEGREVYLTQREFELVRFLIANSGRVVTREMIAQHLWGSEAASGLRTVDVHVRRIRSKLEGGDARCIETVRNVGYKFVAD